MNLDHRICTRAMRSRDPRFDGRFFIGVRSTGIYCRPVCPAPCPKPENVVFYPTAAAAAETGLRPCLRCRPEASPGTPAWSGTSATVSRGLRLIESGVLDRGGVEDLARPAGRRIPPPGSALPKARGSLARLGGPHPAAALRQEAD